MAIKKTAKQPVIHTHLFLGGAVTLLLVLGTAQFALTSHIYDSTRSNGAAFSHTMQGLVKEDTSKVAFGNDFYLSLPAGWEAFQDKGVYRIIAGTVDFGTIYMYREGTVSEESARMVRDGHLQQFVQRIKMKDGYGPDFIIEYLTPQDPSANVYATLEYFVEHNVDFYNAVDGPTVTDWTQAHEDERAYPVEGN